MISREKHTEWLAELTIQKSIEKQMEIFILGKVLKKKQILQMEASIFIKESN